MQRSTVTFAWEKVFGLAGKLDRVMPVALASTQSLCTLLPHATDNASEAVLPCVMSTTLELITHAHQGQLGKNTVMQDFTYLHHFVIRHSMWSVL